MINKIFLDLDECLIHCEVNEDESHPKSFEIEGHTYNVYVRPGANEVVEFSRQLVGVDNVYILTSSVKEYAAHINRVANFGFVEDHIISREHIQEHSVNYDAWGESTHTSADADFAHKDNVLIDNLYPRYNGAKMKLIGITPDRYLKVNDYYGYEDETFEGEVINFLNTNT